MNIIEIAALGLQQDNERMRVISHNVANIATPGYKRQVAVQTPFPAVVDAEMAARTAISTGVDLGAGKLKSTGNSLDVALGDRDFLMVQTAAGTTALSRGGSLQIDAAGRVVTAAGQQVLGAGGALSVPATAGSVRLDANGQLFADDKPVGTLQVMRLKEGAMPLSLGGGLFALRDTADAQVLTAPQLTVGQVEASNVVSSQEMVQLMSTTRHAESMARLIQGADEMLEKTIRKLGEMS
jgi:flagellar basal-body rod protein FlgF